MVSFCVGVVFATKIIGLSLNRVLNGWLSFLLKFLDCALCVVYLVKLKFKDGYSIDTSADIHNAIHIPIHKLVYQLIGVFCDRLKLCSTAAPNCQTGQIKGIFCKQKRSFLLVSLHSMLSVLVSYLIDEGLGKVNIQLSLVCISICICKLMIFKPQKV